MLLKSCAGCGRMISYGMTRCEACEEKHEAYLKERKKQSNRKYNQKYNANRDKKYSQFYHSKEWKMFSQQVMKESEYKCAWCGAKLGSRREDGSIVVLEIDHIDEVKENWEKRFDRKNVRCLCTLCHNKRHKRFQPRGVG